MNMKIKKCCWTCKYWDIDSAKDKAGKVRADRGVACLYPVPDMPISTPWQYRNLSFQFTFQFTSKFDGKECKCYEQR